MLDKGDSAGLIACSDGLTPERKIIIDEVENALYDIGINAVVSRYLYRPEDAVAVDAKLRAEELMDMIRNPEIKAIFDVSGGNVANEILDYLNYDEIAEYNKPIFGYSDLTVLLNAIYEKSGINTYLYQIRNLASEVRERQLADFTMTMSGESDDLYEFEYDFVQGKYMEGVVIGGNVRCFLKLAGTDYMPSFKHKILLLESYSGNEVSVRNYFNQLKQMGAFEEVEGVLLGTFTELAAKDEITAAEILMEVCDDPELAIAVTDDIGHGGDSKAVIIGKELELRK